MRPLNNHDERQKEIEALRACISRLGEANPRISESPDLTTVLREALEGARGVTGARCGAVATLGEAGQTWGSRDFGSHRRGPTPAHRAGARR